MARRIARNARKNEEDAAQSLLLLSVAAEAGSSDTPALECSMSPDVSEDLECSHDKLLDAGTQTDGMYDEAAELKEKTDGQAKFIEQLQQTIQNITMKIKPPSFSEQTFVSDEHVKFYTGLPNITILKAVFDHVLPAVSVSDSSKLMPFQEYVAVLMKFRLNCNHQDLAYQLGVSGYHL